MGIIGEVDRPQPPLSSFPTGTDHPHGEQSVGLNDFGRTTSRQDVPRCFAKTFRSARGTRSDRPSTPSPWPSAAPSFGSLRLLRTHPISYSAAPTAPVCARWSVWGGKPARGDATARTSTARRVSRRPSEVGSATGVYPQRRGMLASTSPFQNLPEEGWWTFGRERGKPTGLQRKKLHLGW